VKYAVIAIIIACWTALAFLYRLGAKKNAPLNWLSASAALTWLVLNVILAAARGADVGSAPRGLYLAGFLGGVGLIAAIPFFMHAVSRGSLAVSWTILTLSFAAVSLLSLAYPGETIKSVGVAGLVTAAAAIALLGWDSAAAGERGGFKAGWGLFMALAFVANTAVMYVYVLGKAWGGIDAFGHKMAFLIAQTAVFFIGSAALCARGRAERKLVGIAVGAALGAVQFAGNYAVLVALGDFNIASYVFFPATTGGSTLTVAFFSAVALGERPGKWGWIGLALGLAALVLLGGAA
jgi:drug/metabolite transporter (DMT)-like permease